MSHEWHTRINAKQGSMATRGGLRIGSKAEVVKNLRALLRVARKRSPIGTRIQQCQWSQHILSQVRASLGTRLRRSLLPNYLSLCAGVSIGCLQYRANQQETNRDKMRALRSQASDYLMLLNGVQEQRVRAGTSEASSALFCPHSLTYASSCAQYLWELDAGVEKKLSGKEIVDRSARRVGLSVPETYADLEDKRKREAAAKYLADKRAKEAAAAAGSSKSTA